MKLYHYTTKENYDQIISSGRLNRSNPWITQDASYGSGWYFTDLPPNHCDIAIALQCWQSQESIKKVQYYLEFEVNDSFPQFCRENVYLIKDWNTTKIKHIGGNQIPNCGKKPCQNCSQGKGIIQRFFDKLLGRN